MDGDYEDYSSEGNSSGCDESLSEATPYDESDDDMEFDLDPPSVSGNQPAIGIDLGTTYCCVAVFRNGKPEVIANEQGNHTTPSTVSYTKETILVGEPADVQRVMDPKNAIINSKRFIGRLFTDDGIKEQREKYFFKIKEHTQNNKVIFEVLHRGEVKNVAPEEVGAALLGKMKKIAENHLGEKVGKAVITVPAYFNDAQRKATKHAATIAGLQVQRIINEPTAAAIAYGLGRRFETPNNNEQTVLVYDLGGGTMDVSVLGFDDSGILEVKATSGNTFLGGEDFSRRLFEHFKRDICMKHHVDISSLPKSELRLTRACEKLKKEMSQTTENVTIELAQLLPDKEDYKLVMNRHEFDELCSDLFELSMKTVDKVIDDAEITKKDLYSVILIGGSTRMPKIKKLLSERFPNVQINMSINPDEAVACGAAIQAALLNGDSHTALEDIVLLDVTPLSLGTSVSGGLTRCVIPRNSIIPTSFSESFCTASHYQTAMEIDVIEGERVLTADNNLLGTFTLRNITPAPAGMESVIVKFDIDANGMLTVNAEHKKTKNSKSIKIDKKVGGELTGREILMLLARAEIMEVEDKIEEERIQSRENFRQFCLEMQLSQSANDPNDLASINEQISWINHHKDSPRETYDVKHKLLKMELLGNMDIRGVWTREENLGFNTCYDNAESHMKSKNYKQAFEWYIRSYHAAGATNKDHETALILKISKSLRLQVEGSGQEYYRSFDGSKWLTNAAQWIVFGLTRKENQLRDELLTELALIKQILFEKEAPRKQIFESIDFIAKFVRLLYNFDIYKCGEKVIDLIVSSYREFLNTSTLYLEHKLRSDYDVKEALDHLHGLFEPIERLAALELIKIESTTTDITANEFKNFVENSIGVAEAKICYKSSSVEFDKLKLNIQLDIDEKIDQALILVDNLNSAMKSTSSCLRVYCKIKLLKGKIFKILLMNDDIARNCCRELIDIGLVQGFDKEAWFSDALAMYKDLRVKKDQHDESEEKKGRAPILEELKDELKKLEDASSLDLKQFIGFLYDNFPVKHKKVVQRPDVERGMKKACILLSALYHPDKVKVDEHGEKYKVLCEEISKKINSRLGSLKGVD